MRKMAAAEGKVDVLGYATYMRTRRTKMIQTEVSKILNIKEYKMEINTHLCSGFVTDKKYVFSDKT